MTKLPRNTDKELLAQAGAGPALMPDYDPDYPDIPVAIDPAEERAWYKSRGIPEPVDIWDIWED